MAANTGGQSWLLLLRHCPPYITGQGLSLILSLKLTDSPRLPGQQHLRVLLLSASQVLD